MKTIQFITYLFLQIIFLPLTVVGGMLLPIKQYLNSKRFGLSATAIEVLHSRWIMHIFGTREDRVTIELSKYLPNSSYFLLWLTILPALLAHKINGYTPSIAKVDISNKTTLANFINKRTVFFDNIIQDSRETIKQVVFLGAGYDSRAFKFYINSNIKIFDLDRKNTQETKIRAIDRAKINKGKITFVAVDFRKESWSQKLIESGFDSRKKTLFIWEGVTLYLKEKDVIQSLKNIGKISASGSILAFDIYSQTFVTGEYITGMKLGVKFLKYVNEPFLYGIDTLHQPEKHIRILLEKAGLALRSVEFLQYPQKEPFCGLVIATKG